MDLFGTDPRGRGSPTDPDQSASVTQPSSREIETARSFDNPINPFSHNESQPSVPSYKYATPFLRSQNPSPSLSLSNLISLSPKRNFGGVLENLKERKEKKKN